MNAVVVLTTVGVDFDARALAQELVEMRLAACVNILPPMVSVYRWEGRVTSDDERLLVIKTTDARVDALREALFARHPYDVPEFVVVNVDGISDGYGAWVIESVAEERRRPGG